MPKEDYLFKNHIAKFKYPAKVTRRIWEIREDGGSGGFIISLKNVFILYEVQRAERPPIASGKRTPKIYTFVLCFIIITLTIISAVYKSIPPMSVT